VIYDDNWPPLNISIILDGNTTAWVASIVHELLHVVFDGPCIVGRLDETLEEVWIVAMETYMIQYINKRKTWKAKWDALVERKVQESEAEKPDRPLEELVAR
jgi:predicted metal-dependent peptidase